MWGLGGLGRNSCNESYTRAGERCAFRYVAVKVLAYFSDRLDLSATAKARVREKKVFNQGGKDISVGTDS